MTARGGGGEARHSILASVRRSLAESPQPDAAHGAPERLSDAPATARPERGTAGTFDRFRTALDAVGGRTVVARDERAAAEAVREILVGLGARVVAVSDSPLVERVMSGAAVDGLRVERAPDRETLFACDAGVTSAQWAVAETGTLVLESDVERHRLASLVPPVHVALVEARCLRETLGEVLREAGEPGADGLSRTLTFVTGPSRTSDIELTLAIGVHGPGALHVVVVTEGGDHA